MSEGQRLVACRSFSEGGRIKYNLKTCEYTDIELENQKFKYPNTKLMGVFKLSKFE